jgi:hypothetical protein
MIKCPFCHFENEEGALFCEQCKSDLGVTEPVPAHHSVGAMPGAPHVVESTPAPERIMESSIPLAAVAIHEAQIADTVPLAAIAEASVFPAESAIPVALPFGEATAIPLEPGLTPDLGPAGAIDATEAPAELASNPATVEATPRTEGTGSTTTADVIGTLPLEPEKLPAGCMPKLVVVRGLKINAEYPVYEGDNYIGRADDKSVDIDLEDQEPDDRVWSSRQHALLTFEDGVLAVEDLNSTNGTFVNRTRVHPGQKRRIQVNDVIQIGTVQMRVKI